MKRTVRPEPEDWKSPVVVLIGLGTGREDLSSRVLSWIGQAEVLAGGRRHLDLFPDFSGEKLLLEAPIEASCERLEKASEHKRIAVIASGDPLFFGIGRRLAEIFGRDRLIVFPNVTSVQTLFARLVDGWEDVKVLSLHGKEGSVRSADWLHTVRSCTKVVLFTDPRHHPGWIARQLLEEGLGDRTLVIAEDLGLPTENIRQLAPEEALESSFSALNLVLVAAPEAGHTKSGESSGRSALPVLGIPDGAFEHEAGLITKMEVRAVVLACLQLKPGLVLWDLGAGSGSVGIEAARIAQLNLVVAVEKNLRRCEVLERNIRSLCVQKVQWIQGKALDVVDRLPPPDRVFIGGSGEELRELLQTVSERLRPGGRVVQTAVTLDTLETIRSFWNAKPFEIEVTQLQVNRSVPISGSLRFEALNPVFIVSVWPKR